MNEVGESNYSAFYFYFTLCFIPKNLDKCDDCDECHSIYVELKKLNSQKKSKGGLIKL